MNIFKPACLLAVLLLTGWGSQAQSKTEAAPADAPPPQLTVQVTLPTAVAVLTDYARSIFSSNPDKLRTLTSKRKSRTSNPVVEFSIDLPKGWGDKKRTKAAEKD